jgi:hypothetical protein
MTGEIHPLASHHLPSFITLPGETDTLMVIVAISLIIGVALIGVFYFKLHALPEHMSHGRASKIQFEIVAVLALLALFTHTTLYWVAALLLAMVRIPDFETPIKSMARALTRMAGGKPAAEPAPPVVVAEPAPPVAAAADPETTEVEK